MMTHPSESQLNELVDGTLAPDEHARVASHVAGCLPCAAAVRQIEALLERTQALPREIAPPADTWEGVRSGTRRAGSRPAYPIVRPAWWRLAAAAAVLAFAAIVGGRLVTSDSSPRPDTSIALSTSPASLEAFAPVEARYVLAASALEQTLAERRAVLDPATIAIIERSLATIDSAIEEARTALANDPGNAAITRLLASTYEQKVTLLRRASELTPRT